MSRAEHFLVPVSTGEGGWALLSPSALEPLNEARMRDIRQLQGFIGGMANRRRALGAGLVMGSSP